MTVVPAGSPATVSLSGGSLLNLASDQDAAKVVQSSGTCADAAAGGTVVVTNLGPDDSQSATTATAQFTWTQAGSFQVCYQPAGGVYASVGGSITVSAVAPSSYTNAFSTAMSPVQITFSGGSGLNLASGQDTAKVVQSSGTCADAAAGGTVVVTNLGPDDRANATTATAQFTWTQAGSFQPCYQVSAVSHRVGQVHYAWCMVHGVLAACHLAHLPY